MDGNNTIMNWRYRIILRCEESLENCILNATNKCSMDDILKKDIFFMVILELSHYYFLENNHLSHIADKFNFSELDKYMTIPDIKKVKLINYRTLSLNNYLIWAFNITTGMINNEAYIIFLNQGIIIGFPTLLSKLYDKDYITDFIFKGKHYTVFSTGFSCSLSEYLKESIIYEAAKKYISDQNNKNMTISCLPNNTSLLVDLTKLYIPEMVNRLKITKFSVFGRYNFRLCYNYLRGIMESSKICANKNGCNLSSIKSNIIPSNTNKINILSHYFVIKDASYSEFVYNIQKSIQAYCLHSKFISSSHGIDMTISRCFHLSLLYVLFNSEKFKSNDYIINSFHPVNEYTTKSYRYLYFDPRIGIFERKHVQQTLIEYKHDLDDINNFRLKKIKEKFILHLKLPHTYIYYRSAVIIISMITTSTLILLIIKIYLNKS